MTTPGRKRIPPVAAGVLGLLMLAAGVTGGALFERGRGRAADGAGAGSSAGAAAASNVDSGGSVEPGTATPGETASAGAAATLAEAQAEARRLKERVAALEKLVPQAASKEERIAQAKEIIECLVHGENDPAAFQRLIKLVGDLDPAMGPYFIEYFDNLKPPYRVPRELYEVTLAAGGPEVAEWLAAKLADDATDGGMRNHLLRVLGGKAEIFSIRSLPVTGPLSDLAFRYVAEGTTAERRAGACLLGGVATVESRLALRRLATSDPEFDVREQAVRALALAGDRETTSWLDTIPTSEAGMSERQKERIQSAIGYAREELKKRFP